MTFTLPQSLRIALTHALFLPFVRMEMGDGDIVLSVEGELLLGDEEWSCSLLALDCPV